MGVYKGVLDLIVCVSMCLSVLSKCVYWRMCKCACLISLHVSILHVHVCNHICMVYNVHSVCVFIEAVY